jgi:effector-binding domain-containing protein
MQLHKPEYKAVPSIRRPPPLHAVFDNSSENSENAIKALIKFLMEADVKLK